jgi:hypothetical protein
MEDSKHRKELARIGVAQVEICDCGMIYLGVGPVTVKLSPEAFEQVVKGVNLAERALASPQAMAGTILPFGPRPVLS